MTTGFVYHQSCVQHDPGDAHPERPARLLRIEEHLRDIGLMDELDVHRPRPATIGELERVHTPAHIEAMRQTSGEPPRALDSDTLTSAGSWEAAIRAAGGALEAVERVCSGTWRNAFVATRPPGHHAERGRAMGFCLFNNIAVAACALRAGGMERVAILDWDVHHGNGTQHSFENDPSVFYASLHQWPLYPGSGAEHERGLGAGEGATLNVCLPSGAGSSAWLGALEDRILPALDSFAPEFVLVSAGFDGHRDDPLAQTELEDGDYASMTRLVLDLAERHAGGRLVSVLEGGYELNALARSAAAHVSILREAPCD